MLPHSFHSTIVRNTMKRLRPYIRTLVAVFELNDPWEPGLAPELNHESAVFIKKNTCTYACLLMSGIIGPF